MIRRALVAAVIVAASLAGCSLQTTGALKGNLHLRADFNDIQTLVPGEEVDISDVQVGSIIDTRLVGYQAEVTMAIKSSQRVPVGTVAVLAQTSLLGEPYVNLELPAHFNSTTGPWLASGALLPGSQTEGIEALVARAGDVLGAIDAGDVGAILQALSTGLVGRGPELNRIVAQLAQVARVLAAQATNLGTVVDGLGQLGAAVAPHSPQLATLIDELTSATSLLAADRQKLIGAVTQLTRLAGDLNSEVLAPHLQQVESLIADLGPVLGSAVQSRSDLEGLITGLDTFVKRLPLASFKDQLLVFVWLAGFVNDEGVQTPLAGTDSLAGLLNPEARS